MQSILILGRQPALGLAELESLYGAEAVSAVSPQVAGLTLHAHDVDFARLGGSTRLAHVLAEVPSTDWKRVERELPKLVTELGLTLPDGKIQLGLSSFGLKISPAKLNATGLTLKKVLRSKLERSVRVTPNPELELNTAQVLHNHLTGATGIELLLVATSDNRTVIARTTKVQDIDSYTLRDRGRPKRDARVGMLPPKLAQVLINLAAGKIENDERRTSNEDVAAVDSPFSVQHSSFTMLDPFCGTGVTLQEALLMGYKVYGTDLEPRMVEYSRANLEWLESSFDIQRSSFSLEVGDATNHTWDPQPSFVAGETYLGRPFTELPSPEVLTTTIGDCNQILTKFLRNVWESIPYGTRLCLAVPAWQTAPGKFRHLPLIDDVVNLGYNRVSFEHVRGEQLLYYREGQIVARELLVITRK